MKTFKQFVAESINDKGVLKAVFVIGIPGAGKSYTVKKLNGTVQPRVVNTDRATEYLGLKLGRIIKPEEWHNIVDKVHLFLRL